MNKLHIDLNCDVGEGFGAYSIGDDERLMPLITSANIACGWHAGDAATMRRTIALAAEHHVAIGAHPGLPDLAGFGRRPMALAAEEVYELVLYQIGALDAFVRAAGATMRHVKPHGALYNTAARDREWADAIVRAVQQFDSSLILVGLANSVLIQAGRAAGLTVAGEAFADRTYQADGTLTDRRQANAVIQDASQAAEQALRLAREGTDVATICIHGDSPNAVHIARGVAQRLREAGIEIRPMEGTTGLSGHKG